MITTKVPKPKPKMFMKERGSPRGLVPTSSFGRLDEPYNAYLTQLDPRGDTPQAQATRQALAAASDDRFQEFLARVNHPMYRKFSLATVAKKCDISLPQFAEFWQKAQKMRALAMAQEGIVSFIPDMVSEAHTQDQACDRCDGWGFVYTEETVPGTKAVDPDDPASKRIRACPACKGTGRAKKAGNAESRKMLLEVTGMAGRGGGSSVKLVQNFGGSTMESAVDKMNRVTFEVGDDVLDADFSESEK